MSFVFVLRFREYFVGVFDCWRD